MIGVWRVALAGIVAGWCCNVRAETVTVHLAASRSYDALSLAHARGLIAQRLAPQGIVVDWQGPYPAMAPQIEAMAAGALDFGTGSSTAFASARAADAPIVVVGYTPANAGYEGIIVPEGSPIKSAADLAGRKVAVNKAGTGEYLLLKTLEYNKMPANSVTRVFMGPSDAASAFGIGLVDAWAVWDPYVSIAEDKFKAKMLIPGTAIGTDNNTLITARAGFLADHPAAARAVFQALMVDDAWAVDSPADAAATWAKYVNQPLEVATLLASHNGNKMVGVGPAETARLVGAADWMFEHKLIPRKPSIADHVADLSSN